MIAFLRAMFWSPEAQADAYAWGAVLLAHAMIGAALTGTLGLALGMSRTAVAVAITYALIWEGGQLAFAHATLADSLVDTAAVTLGALLAAALWGHARLPLAAGAIALAALLTTGIRRRR